MSKSILQVAKEHTLECNQAQSSRGLRVFGGHHSSCWPKLSRNLGCTPSEVPELQKRFKEAGVKAEIQKDGQVKVESQAHQYRLARALGMIDFQAGYSGAYDTDKHKELRDKREAEYKQNMQYAQRVISRNASIREKR